LVAEVGAGHRSRPGGGFGELRTFAELPQHAPATHGCRAAIGAREFVCHVRQESRRGL
jgi:hypothetical protein